MDVSSIEMMAQLHRRRASLALDALEERLRCSSCGARNATVRPVDAEF